MCQIYQKAFQVIVWLGQSETCDALAFTTIVAGGIAMRDRSDRYSRGYLQDWDAITCSMVIDFFAVTHHCPCCDDPLTASADSAVEGASAFLELLQRAWFSRVWVVPEVQCSDQCTTVYSGFHHAYSPDFQSCCILVGDPITQVPLRFRQIGPPTWNHSELEQKFADVAQLFGRKKSKFDAVDTLELLFYAGDMQCSDPKDRLFSIYEFCYLYDTHDFKMDYTPSTMEVYRSFVAGCLSHKHNNIPPTAMFALAGTDTTEEADIEWPSWLSRSHCLSRSNEPFNRIWNRRDQEHINYHTLARNRLNGRPFRSEEHK